MQIFIISTGLWPMGKGDLLPGRFLDHRAECETSTCWYFSCIIHSTFFAATSPTFVCCCIFKSRRTNFPTWVFICQHKLKIYVELCFCIRHIGSIWTREFVVRNTLYLYRYQLPCFLLASRMHLHEELIESFVVQSIDGVILWLLSDILHLHTPV